MKVPAERLAEGLWRLALRTPTLPPATATNTLIVGGDRVAVVEPASPYAPERALLDACVEQLVSQGRELAFIVVTHHHSDHVGDAQRLQRRFGGEICAHPETASRVGFAVDREVDEGDVLELGEDKELRFVFTPGHAPGHLVIEIPHAGVAHVGDLVASEGTVLIDPRDAGDMSQYLDSLRRMSARAAADKMRWVPAHGAVLADPVELAEYYIAHRLRREAKLLASFDADEAALSFEALLARTYDDKPPEILPLARGALEAHVQKLLLEGRVRREGEALWRAAAKGELVR